MSNIHRPTIKTIAKEAGVTPNTVSLALRDSKLVKPDTKSLILEIAARQGYVPNALAESLRSGRSHFIALIFGDVGNPLFAMKTKKMEDALRRQGYQVMILNTNEDPRREVEAVRVAISRKVDGVVLCPCQRGREALDMLRHYHVPCVLVGRNFEDGLEDAVVWDNFTGGSLATSHLLSLGCRRILCLLGHEALSTSHDRHRGYLAALERAGAPVEPGLLCTPVLGRVRETLEQVAAPYDGVFAFSDLLAWETACHIPRNIPIIGFDDVQSFLSVPFSMPSIAADLDMETHHIVELLLARIEQPERPTQKIVLPVWVVKR